jgi:two-component sensor histidine kinase
LVKGTEIISVDVQSSAELMADARSYEAINARAELAIPLLRQQQLNGILFVHSEVPRTWTPFEISFARAVADRTYAAIAKIQAEADQRLLNEELGHRLKNTLAMVQAIATQTLRGAADRDAVQTLTSRIAAMSKAHDVLLQQRWVGARIRAVIESTLESHSGQQQLYTDGPDLNLNARTALRLSLLLHELATNALKYGALSRDSGRVDLNWGIMGTGAAAELALRWQESGGPTTREPVKLGLGSRLINSGLSGTGDGAVSYLPTGLIADFHVLLAEIENM